MLTGWGGGGGPLDLDIRGHTPFRLCMMLLGGMRCSSGGAVCLAVEGTAVHPEQLARCYVACSAPCTSMAAWLTTAYRVQPATRRD